MFDSQPASGNTSCLDTTRDCALCVQEHLQLWASYRGQLLARTVRGVALAPALPVSQHIPLQTIEHAAADLCLLSYNKQSRNHLDGLRGVLLAACFESLPLG